MCKWSFCEYFSTFYPVTLVINITCHVKSSSAKLIFSLHVFLSVLVAVLLNHHHQYQVSIIPKFLSPCARCECGARPHVSGLGGVLRLKRCYRQPAADWALPRLPANCLQSIWAAHHPTPHRPGFTSHRIEDRKLFMFMRALGQINELFITQYKG